MKKSNKQGFRKYLTKRNSIIGGVVLLILLIFMFTRGGEKEMTTVVEQGLFQKQTRVAGKVVAKEEAILGFTKSGRIEGLSVKVGDEVVQGQVLARLNQDGASATVALAQSNVAFEDAKFDELVRGSRVEELRIQESKVRDSQSSQVTAEQNLYQELINAYSVAEDAIIVDIDQAFDTADGFGKILPLFSNYSLSQKINDQRREMRYLLNRWEDFLETLSRDDVSATDVQQTKTYLMSVQAYATLVGQATAEFEATSQTSQETVDRYKMAVSSGRTSVQAQIKLVNDKEQAYQTATQSFSQSSNQLDLLQAGASSEELAAQRARVAAEQARLQDARTVLSEGSIRAPFSGTIVQVNAEEGEPTAANSPVLIIISDEGIEIESFIPEVFIGSVTKDDTATIIFDAYPGRVFKGVVDEVEPKDTLRDGISTYRTAFQFDDEGANILLGMTADVDILAEERPDTLMIPLQAIQYENGQAYVFVRQAGAADGDGGKNIDTRDTRFNIVVGDVDSQGRQEILSGLEVGNIIIYGRKN